MYLTIFTVYAIIVLLTCAVVIWARLLTCCVVHTWTTTAWGNWNWILNFYINSQNVDCGSFLVFVTISCLGDQKNFNMWSCEHNKATHYDIQIVGYYIIIWLYKISTCHGCDLMSMCCKKVKILTLLNWILVANRFWSAAMAHFQRWIYMYINYMHWLWNIMIMIVRAINEQGHFKSLILTYLTVWPYIPRNTCTAVATTNRVAFRTCAIIHTGISVTIKSWNVDRFTSMKRFPL